MRESATEQSIRAVSRLQANAEEMIRKQGFLGIPAETFADARHKQFITLLNEGLNRESVVLDLGCGCLRRILAG